MESTQTETLSPFNNLVKVIGDVTISANDRMKIYEALIKYIENDTKIIKNLNTETWNVDTKQ
jgi:hypothetical protein